MRTLFLTTVLGTALFACTSEVKSSDFARPDGGVTGSGDGGVKTGTPIKSPTPAEPAPATCRGAVECLADCEEDAACDACYGDLPDADLLELQELSLCIADSECTTDECVAEVCADVIDTCLAE